MIQNSKKSDISLLKEYVKQMLEVKVMVGGEEFDVPDEMAKKIKNLISKKKKNKSSEEKKETDESFQLLLSKLAEKDQTLADELEKRVYNTHLLKEELIDLLSKKIDDKKIEQLASSLFSIAEVPLGLGVEIPNILQDIADLKTESGAGGQQVGAGEIVTCLLFLNAEQGAGNDPYDVKINEEPWHIKEGTRQKGIKMGSADGRKLIDTNIAEELVLKKLAKISDFSELGQKKFAKLLEDWTTKDSTLGSPSELYDRINAESIAASMGEAKGVIWYQGNQLIFIPKDSLSIAGATQGGRVIVAINGKEKVLRYIV